jgi:subtilase family serine protease
VSFSAIIKNQGTAATPSGVTHRVSFSVDGTQVNWSNTSTTSLAPGPTTTLTANGGPSGSSTWTATSGTHTILASVDDTNLIAESNESNNTPSSSLTVGSSQTQLLLNPGFESGAVTWVTTPQVISNSTSRTPNTGSWYAWLDGFGQTHTDSLYQQITIPSGATSATLTFYLKIDTAETTTSTAYDTLNVQVRNSANTVLATLVTYSNLNKTTSYFQKSFDLTAYKGQTISVYFLGVEDSSLQTSFYIDDTAVIVIQ